VAGPARPSGLHRQPGDGWVECACGGRHWGLHGAAGLLLFRRDASGRPSHVVLQHRAEWSDAGGTWALPGGALQPGEPAVEGAIREAVEEAGLDRARLHVLSSTVLDHTTWSYTTVVAETTGPQDPRATDAESVEVRWVPLAAVASLALHPAFGQAWPRLLAVVDAA
jgi:8-oxo-dGTP diphosphatase